VQFAIDSGILIFGIKENKDGTLALTPVELAGFAERIEQVARSIPDPLVSVTFKIIPCQGDPSKGYVFVKIPSTSEAPHMVDGVYYGRGDKMKVKLSDIRVRELHHQRAGRRINAEERLAQIMKNDPTPSQNQSQAHIFLVATPQTLQPGKCMEFIRGAGNQERVHKLINLALTECNLVPNETGPLNGISDWHLRTDGVALTSMHFQSGRPIVPMYSDEVGATELEISEDGEIRIFYGSFSRKIPPQWVSAEGAPASYVLFDALAPILTRQLISLATELAHQTGLRCEWSFGLGASGIAGLAAATDRMGRYRPIYDSRENYYSMVASASLVEME
jgi:hypothetical protein